MNTTQTRPNRRASDMTPVDIAAIATMLVAEAVGIVAGATGSSKLMGIAAAIALPAGVAKVWSTRVKARHEVDPSGRDRRVRDGAPGRVESSAAIAS